LRCRTLTKPQRHSLTTHGHTIDGWRIGQPVGETGSAKSRLWGKQMDHISKSAQMLKKLGRAGNSHDRSLADERAEAVGSIIERSRLVAGLPALEAADYVAAIAAWNEILEDIPTYWLDECYQQALKVHRARDPFCVSEVYQQWDPIHRSNAYE